MSLYWISNEAVKNAIHQLLEDARNAVNEAQNRMSRNVIDPFLSAVIAATFDLANVKGLTEIRLMESGLRGLSNHIGRFHQSVLGSVEGWEDHDSGHDLESEGRRIIAEIKNKHNTLNASARSKAIQDLDAWRRSKGAAWTAYLVEIIPKKPERLPPQQLGNRVFGADGVAFYEIATGDPNALHNLLDYVAAEISPTPEIADYCANELSKSLPPRLNSS